MEPVQLVGEVLAEPFELGDENIRPLLDRPDTGDGLCVLFVDLHHLLDAGSLGGHLGSQGVVLSPLVA